MKLGTQVGLGAGHILLDGDPAPLLQRGAVPLEAQPPSFRPMSIVATVATTAELLYVLSR